MPDPPDKILKSGTIPLSEKRVIDAESDWIELGLDSGGRVEDDQLVIGPSLEISLDASLEDDTAAPHGDFSVGVSVQNDEDSEIEMDGVEVETVDDDGKTQSSTTVSIPALSPGEQHEDTAFVSSSEFGSHNVWVSAEGEVVELDLDITSIDVEVTVSSPDAINPDEELNIDVQIENQDLAEFLSTDVFLHINNEDHEQVWSTTDLSFPSLSSGSQHTESVTVSADVLDAGSYSIVAGFGSKQIKDEDSNPLGHGGVEVFDSGGDGVVLEIPTFRVDDVEDPGAFYADLEGKFVVENTGTEDAENVEYQLDVLNPDGSIFESDVYSGVRTLLEPTDQMVSTEFNSIDNETRSGTDTYTARVSVDADGLDEPVVKTDEFEVGAWSR